jgi:thymidylate synthase
MMMSPALTCFNPVYKPRQLICGQGHVVVVTGWTVKTAVAKHLAPSDYAAIGQLYSPTRGISILVRNLLANPQVRHLVILDATREDQNAGGCAGLVDFFEQGFQAGQTDTGRECWVIHSPTRGYIDPEIPAEVLQQLRQAITIHRHSTIRDAVAQVETLAAQPLLPAWGQPQLFPMAEATTRLLPGPYYGHRIQGKTIAETWVKIIQRIKTTGVVRPSAYDSQWQELIDLVAIVTDEPEEFYFPEPNYLPCTRAFIQDYVNQILADAPEREGVKYTYGQRLRSWFGVDQIEQVIAKLCQDLSSSRAVMSLWDVQDHTFGDSPPCLNHIWVRIAEQELSLTATFRSNDMFSAWPANAMGLRALQQQICREVSQRAGLTLTLGPLVTISQSAHIYDDCWENAERVIDAHYRRILQHRDYADPAGSFVISLSETEILVEQMTPGTGEGVGCYQAKTAAALYRQIAAAAPALEVEHALYLGTELQKAELALQQGIPYEQDRPLKLASL